MGKAKVTKIEYHGAAFRALNRSKDVLADLTRRGQNIAGAAGEGVGIQASVGANRARVTVATETREAAVREAEEKTLTRSIGAGRG